MDHIAILKKTVIKTGDNLLESIIRGKKTIESRWYVNKIAPWDKISAGDNIYFKESGSPVTAKAIVTNVLQYENLNSKIIREIINKYGEKIAPNTSKKDFLSWAIRQKNKNYCILVFFKDVKTVEPFKIDKRGYGISSAWLVTNDIYSLRKHA